MLQGRTRTGPKPVNLRSRALPVVGARRVEVGSTQTTHVNKCLPLCRFGEKLKQLNIVTLFAQGGAPTL